MGEREKAMKVKDTIKKPYGICPASMTIWNADQTYNKKGMEKYLPGCWIMAHSLFPSAEALARTLP